MRVSFIAVILTVSLPLVSCSDSTFIGKKHTAATVADGQPQDADTTGRPSPAAGISDEQLPGEGTPTEVIAEPQMIAGAYLVACINAPANPGKVFCRLEDGNAAKVNLPDIEWLLRDQAGKRLPAAEAVIRPLAPKSNWHIEVDVIAAKSVSVTAQVPGRDAGAVIKPFSFENFAQLWPQSTRQMSQGPGADESLTFDAQPLEAGSASAVLWNFWQGKADLTFTGEVLRCTVPANAAPDYSGIVTAKTYNFANGAAQVRVVSAAVNERGSEPFNWGLTTADQSNYALVLLDYNRLVVESGDEFGKRRNDVKAYNPSEDRYLRIEHSAALNSLLFLSSSDGSTWSVLTRMTAPSWLSSGINFEVHCGAWLNVGSASATLDDFRLYLPEPQP